MLGNHGGGDVIDELFNRINERVSDIGGGDGNGGKGGNGGNGGRRGGRRAAPNPFGETLRLATDFARRIVIELAGDMQRLADIVIGNERVLSAKIDAQDVTIADLMQRIERLEAAAKDAAK